jgi:hypothetical protein
MFADDGLDDDIVYPKKDTTDANMHIFFVEKKYAHI